MAERIKITIGDKVIYTTPVNHNEIVVHKVTKDHNGVKHTIRIMSGDKFQFILPNGTKIPSLKGKTLLRDGDNVSIE